MAALSSVSLLKANGGKTLGGLGMKTDLPSLPPSNFFKI